MTQEERHVLWEAMAEQFLDTERRQQIPAIAAQCVRAQLSIAEARDIWRYEVTPAVWPNLWSVAGEWAYWPTDWLVDRIETAPRRRCALGYWTRAWPIDSVWRAIGACMEVLEPLSPEAALAMEADLTWLAEVYFDFLPGSRPTNRSSEALHTCYQQVFLPIFSRLVVEDEATHESQERCRARVERALREEV